MAQKTFESRWDTWEDNELYANGNEFGTRAPNKVCFYIQRFTLSIVSLNADHQPRAIRFGESGRFREMFGSFLFFFG